MEPKEMQKAEENETLLPISEPTEKRRTPRKQRNIFIHWTLIACSITAGVAAGYLLGHHQKGGSVNYGLPAPPGSVRTSWHHNFTFTQKPDSESEAAWSSIIPVGRGFIHHPQLAPFISNIAVFHQLHCLHAIVVAYYDALSSQPMEMADIPDFDAETGTRTAPFHVRHCFDYLRQTLMCAADTNLEVLNPETHTTNGWNQTKICRNYTLIKDFAERWANSSDMGIVT